MIDMPHPSWCAVLTTAQAWAKRRFLTCSDTRPVTSTRGMDSALVWRFANSGPSPRTIRRPGIRAGRQLPGPQQEVDPFVRDQAIQGDEQRLFRSLRRGGRGRIDARFDGPDVGTGHPDGAKVIGRRVRDRHKNSISVDRRHEAALRRPACRRDRAGEPVSPLVRVDVVHQAEGRRAPPERREVGQPVLDVYHDVGPPEPGGADDRSGQVLRELAPRLHHLITVLGHGPPADQRHVVAPGVQTEQQPVDHDLRPPGGRIDQVPPAEGDDAQLLRLRELDINRRSTGWSWRTLRAA